MAYPQFTTHEIENEEWRPVPGYEHIYAVSNLGRFRREVASTRTPAKGILSGGPNKDGYIEVKLCSNGRAISRRLHCIVASVFLGTVPEGHEVNHKDGVKNNNRSSNLEYLTHAQNMRHATEVINAIQPTRSRGIARSKASRLYSEDYLSSELLRCAQILGHRPSAREFNNITSLNERLVARYFGSWNNALNKVFGLNLSSHSFQGLPPKISDHELLEDLRRVSCAIGRELSIDAYMRLGRYSAQSQIDRFGKWSTAKKRALDITS